MLLGPSGEHSRAPDRPPTQLKAARPGADRPPNPPLRELFI
jgi:hypothetical protein